MASLRVGGRRAPIPAAIAAMGEYTGPTRGIGRNQLPNDGSRGRSAWTPAPRRQYRSGVESRLHRARSSVGERSLHTREVGGSKPPVPITRAPQMRGLFLCSFAAPAVVTLLIRPRG